MKQPRHIALLVFVSICFILVAGALTLNLQEALQSTGSQNSEYQVNALPTSTPISEPTRVMETPGPTSTPDPIGMEDEA